MKKLSILLLSIFTFVFGSNLQLMHASSIGEVSISINGENFLKKVNYLDNTGLFKVERGSTLEIFPHDENYAVEFSTDDLERNNHLITAIGPSQSDRNLRLVSSPIKTKSNSRNHFGLKILNAFHDESSLDIYIGDNLAYENLSYGMYSDYVQLRVGFKNILIKNHQSGQELAYYIVNLNNRGGETGVLIASGKFDRDYADLKLINPIGSTISVLKTNLEVTGLIENEGESDRHIMETAQVQIVHNSPYPVVDVYVDGTLALEDVAYRASTGLLDLPVNTEVGIAPADGDVIATFPFQLAENATYVVVASGIVGDDVHPFNLLASTLDTAAPPQ